jgi:hypothetical protein
MRTEWGHVWGSKREQQEGAKGGGQGLKGGQDFKLTSVLAFFFYCFSAVGFFFGTFQNALLHLGH